MQVVTVLELFSPTDKYGEGRGIYMKKRRDFSVQPIHIVKLDRLRVSGRLEFARRLPPGHYHAFISRAEHRPDTDVYTCSVRDKLPTIAIPLQDPDLYILLDLSIPFTVAYDAGRYRRIVDHTAAPAAPMFANGCRLGESDDRAEVE